MSRSFVRAMMHRAADAAATATADPEFVRLPGSKVVFVRRAVPPQLQHVLLDELPNAHNDEISRQLQVMLRRALATARFPMALVLCTGADSSTSMQKQLETLLGPDAQSALLTTVQVNPVADTPGTLLSAPTRNVSAGDNRPCILPPLLK